MKLNNRWIKVDDKLPPYHERVLALFRQDQIAFISISELTFEKMWDLTNIQGKDLSPSPLVATHWMPLYS